MILSSFEIRNFRSISHLLISPKEITTFIGKNSCGKSNILKALQFFFTSTTRSIEAQDICTFADDGGTWVECVFSSLTVSEKDALEKYLRADGSIRVRRTLRHEGDKCVTEINGYVQLPTEVWLQEDYADYADIEKWKVLGINVSEYATVGARGKLTKEGFATFRKAYVAKNQASVTFTENLSPTEFKGRQSTAAAILPHFIFVPAVGDIVSVIYGKQSSLLNEIVGSIIARSKSDPGYQEAQQSLVAAQDFVNPSARRLAKLAEIEQDIAARLASWPGTTVSIRTQVDDLAKLLISGLKLSVHDGHDTELTEKGDGIQRQILFRIFQLYADFRARRGIFKDADAEDSSARGPSIIAFEEPELFLHPQAQEAFYDDLIAVSKVDQVLLATHSSYLIRLDMADGLHIIRRESSAHPTGVRTANSKWLEEDDKLRLKEMNLCSGETSKLFFADRVILTEGQEDLIYINGTARDHSKCLNRAVTVIEAGGKESIPTLQRVMNAFMIRYIVACDDDPGNVKSQQTTAKIQGLVEVANKQMAGVAILELFTPNLPHECHGCVPPTTDDKVVTAFKYIRDGQPQAAFRTRVESLFKLV
jgi:CRISPR-associated exonuclease Cas4